MSYTVYHFYLGKDENTAKEFEELDGSDVGSCPRVGEKIKFYSTRDRHGDYVHKNSKFLFEGYVTRVEHTIEERGYDAASNRKIHFVSVFLQ